MKKLSWILLLVFSTEMGIAQEMTFGQFRQQDYGFQADEVHLLLKVFREEFQRNKGNDQSQEMVVKTAFLDFFAERYPVSQCRGKNQCALNFNFHKYTRFTSYNDDSEISEIFASFMLYLYNLRTGGKDPEKAKYKYSYATHKKAFETFSSYSSTSQDAGLALSKAFLETFAEKAYLVGLYPNIKLKDNTVDHYYSDFQLMLVFNYSQWGNDFQIIFNPLMINEPVLTRKDWYWLVDISCKSGECFTVKSGKTVVPKNAVQLRWAGEEEADLIKPFTILKEYGAWLIEEDYFNY